MWVVSRDDGPWFVLADLCNILDISNVAHAASRLDDDEKNTIAINEGIAARGNPNAIGVNESGLWSLVLTSRKPEARRFKKWLTAEVIPSIRKTGSYSVEAVQPLPAPAIPNEPPADTSTSSAC